MIKDNRIIYDDNGTKVDYSLELNKIQELTLSKTLVALEDKIYIGSSFPFNSRFFNVSTVNTNASVVTVKVYDGSAWTAVADKLDGTSLSGASMGKSGILQFTPSNSVSWPRVSNSADITELSDFTIYNMYWLELSFSANFSATVFNYIGHKFCDDEQLYSFYPELGRTEVKSGFETGKTTWIEQEVAASDVIISDLIKKGRIVGPSQILNWEKFTIPCIHQTASLVFRAMGDDWKDQFAQAIKDYKEAIEMSVLDIDWDNDGRLDLGEQLRIQTVVRR